MIEYLRAQWEERPILVIVAVTAPIAFVITFLAILAANGGGGGGGEIVSLQEQQSQAQADVVVLQQQEQQQTPVVQVRTTGAGQDEQQSSAETTTQPAQPARPAEAAESSTDAGGEQAQTPAPVEAAEEQAVAEEETLPALEDVLVEQIDRSSLKYGGSGEEGAILPIDNGVVPSSGPRFATSWELMVPSARIYASIKKVGRTPNGAMGAPDNPDVIGWLDSSAEPGEAGNALMVGHRDYTDINGKVGYGVCWELDKSSLGDAIIVIDTDNAVAYVYEVIEKVTVDPTDPDALSYLRQTEEPVVTLITCNGSFDVETHTYSHRLVLVGLLRHMTRV